MAVGSTVLLDVADAVRVYVAVFTGVFVAVIIVVFVRVAVAMAAPGQTPQAVIYKLSTQRSTVVVPDGALKAFTN